MGASWESESIFAFGIKSLQIGPKRGDMGLLYRGAPFESERWQQITAAKLGLEDTLRPPGRPTKQSEGGA